MGPQLATVSLVLLTFFVNSHQSPYAPSPGCPPYFNGSIAGSSCSQEYSICVNGVRQAATCSDGYVFYGAGCVPVEESPECEVSDDVEEEPSFSFDCSDKSNGVYSLGCQNDFVKCVHGHAYQMFCPADLLYNAIYNECLESCDEIEGYQQQQEEETTTTTTSVPASDDNSVTEAYNNQEEDAEVYDEVIGGPYESTTVGYEQPEQPTTEEPEPVEFDCAEFADGIYADGCQSFFYVCSNGIAFKKFCPAGTVYNPSQKACDYDCTTATTTTTQSYEQTTEADVPSTTTTEYATTTTSQEPVYTTTPQEDVPSTTTVEYQTTTIGFDDVEPETTTTEAPSTTTWTTTTTTQAPFPVCSEGQVTTFGTCSSRFTRCQNNSIRSKQCPVDTLFETALLLCVFDLPECQPTTVPVNQYTQYTQHPTGPQPDIVVSPFDDNVHLRPRFDRRRPVFHHDNRIIDNPFFVPPRRRHHNGRRDHRRGPLINSPFSTHTRGRAFLNDGFKDFRRVRTDKLNYGEARRVEGDKRFLIDDSFDGRHQRLVGGDIDRIFPKSRSSRRLGPRYDPDGYEDGSGFAPEFLYGASRKKRSTYYGGAQDSGNNNQDSQSTARQTQVNQSCQGITTPTFLTFGDCFAQFIYCSGTGVNRFAACPIGESFDKTLGACSETCGVAGTPTVSTGTQTTGSTVSTADDDNVVTSAPIYTGNDEPTFTTTTSAPSSDAPVYVPTTTKAPIGDRCTQVSTGLFAIGCSQKYIQCSNGAAIVRQCPASLYFHEAASVCNFRDQVPECQVPTPGQDEPSSTTSGYGYAYTAGPGQDQQSTTSGYGYTAGPGQDQQSTTSGYGYTAGPGQDQHSTTSGYGYTAGPGQDQSSTTSGYNGPSDDQSSSTTYQPTVGEDRPTTYSPTVAPYNPVIVAQDQDACFGLSDGSHGQGCSSSYIVCSGGHLVSSINCALGEGFDPSVQYCRSFNDIPAQACDDVATTTDSGLAQPLPYVTLETVLTSTTEEPTTTGVYSDDDDVANDDATTLTYDATTVASDEETSTDASYSVPSENTTDSYGRTYEEEDDEDLPAADEEKCVIGTRAAVGFCVQTYLECAANGYVEKSCRRGKNFDTHANKCVPRVICGKDAIREAVQDVIATTTTVSPKKIDGRCAHVDGEAVFALGSCSSNYVRCSYGTAKLEHCARKFVFSNAEQKCVDRDSNAECTVAQNQPVKSYYNNHEQSAYCDGKADGLYGNKRDCSAILQCFGGELFEHPSCPSSLAFNELTGKCDYPQKVSGCENHGRTEGSCSEHGAFIADVDNCSVFYRCVWGRKVTMRCPSGTVFNPSLSVCDWPNAVPSCGPSSDDVALDDYTTTTTASSYYNNNSGY